MGKYLKAVDIAVGTKSVDGNYQAVGYLTNQGDEVIVVQDYDGQPIAINVNDVKWALPKQESEIVNVNGLKFKFNYDGEGEESPVVRVNLFDSTGAVKVAQERVEQWIAEGIEDLVKNPEQLCTFCESGDSIAVVSYTGDWDGFKHFEITVGKVQHRGNAKVSE